MSDTWAADKIELWPANKLTGYDRNARTHTDQQIGQIAASIAEFGFTNPILAGSDGVIIAGHGRLAAALTLGLESVPVIVLDHLSEVQRRALVIADNQIAINAGWDAGLLRFELDELESVGFDVGLLGFGGLAGGDPGYGGVDPGVEYKENFAIIVACQDEADQEATFNRLQALGLECKVLVN